MLAFEHQKVAEEFIKIANEKEQFFQKIVKDAQTIKNLVDENERNKMLAYKHQIALEKKNQENAQLKQALGQQTFPGQFQTK